MSGPIAGGARAAISTTALQLSTSEDRIGGSVTIKALAGNSAPVYVGGSGVTAETGYPLAAGEEVKVGCVSPSEVYVIAGSGSQEVRWIAN